MADNQRVMNTKIDLEARISTFNKKINEVRVYIQSLRDDEREKKQRCGDYQDENNKMGDKIDKKDGNIDDLETEFARKHDDIKQQVEIYIELEHENEKYLQETRHKVNLTRVENEKAAELNHIVGTFFVINLGNIERSIV